MEQPLGPVLEALRGPDGEARLQAIEALGRLSPPPAEAVAALDATLRHPDGQARAGALRALLHIRPPLPGLMERYKAVFPTLPPEEGHPIQEAVLLLGPDYEGVAELVCEAMQGLEGEGATGAAAQLLARVLMGGMRGRDTMASAEQACRAFARVLREGEERLRLPAARLLGCVLGSASYVAMWSHYEPSGHVPWEDPGRSLGHAVAAISVARNALVAACGDEAARPAALWGLAALSESALAMALDLLRGGLQAANAEEVVREAAAVPIEGARLVEQYFAPGNSQRDRREAAAAASLLGLILGGPGENWENAGPFGPPSHPALAELGRAARSLQALLARAEADAGTGDAAGLDEGE